MKNVLRRPNRKQVLTAAAVPILLVAAAMIYGLPYSQAQGTCYTQVKVCHGVLFNSSCTGLDQEKIEFDDESQCSQVSEIQQQCSSARENLCATQVYNDTGWKEAVVKGFSCSTWESEYDGVDLKSCTPQ